MSRDLNDNKTIDIEDYIKEHEVKEDLSKQLEKYKEDILYKEAELQNERKRFSLDLKFAKSSSYKKALSAFIPIYSSIKAGIAISDNEDKKEYLNPIISMFEQSLNAIGINKVDNTNFDPKYFQCISTIKDENKEDFSVSQVIQDAWSYEGECLVTGLMILVKN